VGIFLFILTIHKAILGNKKATARTVIFDNSFVLRLLPVAQDPSVRLSDVESWRL